MKSRNEISALIWKFNLDTKPIIDELVKINALHIPTYLIYKDGRIEVKDNYNDEQLQVITYLHELIDIERNKIKERIECYQKCYL